MERRRLESTYSEHWIGRAQGGGQGNGQDVKGSSREEDLGRPCSSQLSVNSSVPLYSQSRTTSPNAPFTRDARLGDLPTPPRRSSDSTPPGRLPAYFPSRPPSLALPVSSPLPRTSSKPRLPTRPSSLAIPRQAEFSLVNDDPRRHTLIDFAGVVQPDRSRNQGGERILVGDWSPKPKPPRAPARIMDFSELEEKHRKRMSQSVLSFRRRRRDVNPFADCKLERSPFPTSQLRSRVSPSPSATNPLAVVAQETSLPNPLPPLLSPPRLTSPRRSRTPTVVAPSAILSSSPSPIPSLAAVLLGNSR